MAPQEVPPEAVGRVRSWFLAARTRAALLAAGVAAVAFCIGDAVAGSYPFGSRTRSVNDLGNQFVPYHAHLWDLLHGRADGGLLLNWQSGYGSSFLPDLGTYVSSPFALLVAFFPRDRIDLAVYAVTVLKIGAAAAAMAVLLLALRPGRWWAAGALGASYALCGWTVMLASYNPMWLDGLIAFPLLCLVGEWARTARRPYLSVLVVALCWIANFYTAYMATIGAGLVLIARLLTEPDRDDTTAPDRTAQDGTAQDGTAPGVGGPGGTREPREWLRALGRAARSMVLGIGLSAPLVLTIFKGTKLAYPGLVQEFEPKPWSDLLGRMLPGTYGFTTPSTYIDTAALLLAFALPFHPAVPRRTRTVWTVLVLVVTASFQWKPTHLLWHAFTTPNGSAYRETFVLSGMMVIAGWFAFAHGLPGRRQLAWATGVMAALVAVTRFGAEKGVTGQGTYPLLALGLVATIGALLLLRWAADRSQGGAAPTGATAATSASAPAKASATATLPVVLAATLLIGAQIGQSAFTNAWDVRKRLATMDDYGQWGQRETYQYDAVAKADGWPDYRTDPGREQTVGNDPLMVDGQGAQYYSSLTADVWTKTLMALGGGWTSRGRSLQSLDNPVTDVIFSVGARVHSRRDPHQVHVNPPPNVPPTVTRQEVPPLVTMRDAAPAGRYGLSPYRNQELLLGSAVYTPTTAELRDSKGRLMPRTSKGYRVTGYVRHPRTSTYSLRTSCPAGSEVYFWSPDFKGQVTLPGAAPVDFLGRMPTHRAAVERLGDVPRGGGKFALKVRALEPGTLSSDGVGCLDRGRLAAAERKLAAGAATRVQVTDDGISAQLPSGAHGFAVVAAPAITGWSCATDKGSRHPARSYLGLISVPVTAGATSVSCSFTPPGLHLGEAIGGASLLGVAALAAFGWWRGRRRPEEDGDSEPVRPVPAALVES
ncbi:YfhO family protein [Streptomyces sp. NPDC088197]|uniref:YfhO family protein n=1 Tax=Streptomyces sp. NPDC088197 TaxID=3365840 RepID=UPI0037F97765